MFLKSLTLKGFKSFAETTTLDFEPGVTVVVGPNGSGKSNVVDAVAWVLGAQAPRAMRSSRMDDVIFAGTARRPALGRAEVSLTIDNGSGLLPVDLSEVTITRTLFRSGESEYAVNGVPCRLLDIQELLSDSGVGRQQHVIVSQGQLDAVLNSPPTDRRLVIEEAAGVLKFRRRRERAQRRLESTEANLLRLQDLVREVRRQLRPLEKQADAARRHGAVVSELEGLRLFLAGRELAGARGRQATLSGAARELAAAERGARLELDRLDEEVAAGERSLSAAADRSGEDALGEALVRAEGMRERALGLSAVLAERYRSVERQRLAGPDAGLVASLEADAARLAAQLAEVDGEISVTAPEAASLAEAEAALTAERQRLEVAEGAPAGEREAGDRERGPGAAEVRGELAARRSALARSRQELAALDQRRAALEGKGRLLSAEASRLRQQLAEAQGAEEAVVAQLDAKAAVRERWARARSATDERVREAEAQHRAWAARVEALALALDEARARAGAERLAGLEGVVGALLELVRVDEGWEAAFASAAGEALNGMVVDSPATARRALSVLRQAGDAGAVMPVPAVDGRRSGADHLQADGSAAPLPAGPPARSGADHLQADGSAAPLPAGPPAPPGTEAVRSHVHAEAEGVAALLDSLLARAVAVTAPGASWEAALDLALDHPGIVVVTREGDRFDTALLHVGASGSGATAAALEEAARRAAEAASALDDARREAAAAAAACTAAAEDEAVHARALDQHDGRMTAATDALQRLEAERRDLLATEEAIRLHQAELGERVTREQERVAELEQVLPGLEHEEALGSQRAAAHRLAVSALEERVAALRSRRAELEARAAGLQERRALLDRQRVAVERRLQGSVAARAEAESRRVRLEAETVATERLRRLVEGAGRRLEGVLARVRRRRQEEVERTAAITRRVGDLRRQRAAAEAGLRQLQEELQRTGIAEAEARVRSEALAEAVRRDLDSDPEAAMAAPCPPLPAGASPPGRARELERELRLMGPVNPLALEELAALQERDRFLEAQLQDVRSTRRELAKVIKAVDDEIVTVFRAAYADVSDNFTKLFSTLFPGGSGRLVLTDPDDLLETGIEVDARPSGKNVRKLSLLSGGERSLTALAFLFAVFRSRPSPFYLMDEVEAALDDVNLHRFLELVDEFRSEAQLVVVSHQKRTMEAADVLYGVTMPPGGSSRVVSERIAGRYEVAPAPAG